MKKSILILLFIFLLPTCTDKPEVSTEYLNEINERHNYRIERLKAEDGWLNLAGLFWLKEGENTFGSGAGNDIVFPGKNTPKHIGSFILKDSKVNMEVKPGIKVVAGDSIIVETEMNSDISGNAWVFSLNSLRWFLIDRDGKMGIRLRDLESKLVKEFEGIERFDVDPKFRILAKSIPYETPKEISIPTVLGTVSKDTSYGKLEFEIEGEKLSLEPLGKNRLFIIFADKTNGIETYGAGRFLYTDGPDSLGNVILDFNKSYNPPCAFTGFATCPLPPETNYLNVSIEAGEKKFGEH